MSDAADEEPRLPDLTDLSFDEIRERAGAGTPLAAAVERLLADQEAEGRPYAAFGSVASGG